MTTTSTNSTSFEPVTGPSPGLPPSTLAHLRNFFASGRYTTIAEETGLSKSHVSRVIAGKATPGLEVSAKLAKAAGVDIETFREFLKVAVVDGNGSPKYESRKLTQAEQREIERDRKLGCRKLGERYGVSPQTISVYLRSLKGK